jgi:hypothetical protein
MLGRTFCPLGDAAALPTISIVEDSVFPFRRTIVRIGPLAMGRHHGDFPAKVLFVEPECLPAIAGIVDIGA